MPDQLQPRSVLVRTSAGAAAAAAGLMLLLAAPPVVLAQPSADIIDARLVPVVDSVQAWIDRDRIVGAAMLVMQDGRVQLQHAAGWSDRERDERMRVDHIVRMRSMTKPLVGAGVLMLHEEGRFALEDRVARHLPSFDVNGSRDITIFQLLTHTAGLRGDIYTDAAGTPYATLREAVDAIGAAGPAVPPGSSYSYSDPGSSTLGALIEQLSGQPAEDFLTRRILEPLGMHDSFFMFDLGDPRRERVASTYRRSGDAWERYWDNTQPQVVPFFRASGGLYATAHDYARFLNAMLNHGTLDGARILSPASVSLALQPHAAYAFPPERRDTMHRFYGFHWTVYTDRYGPVAAPYRAGIFQHAGSDGTMGWVDPHERLVIVYLTQSRGAGTQQEFVRLVYDALRINSSSVDDVAPAHGAAPAGQVARSRRGMVTSAEPHATAAGVRMLERGGNAVDAAVATAFALGVVEPSMSGIGGRTQVLIRTPAGEFVGIDGFTEEPAAYTAGRRAPGGDSGYGAVGIPGTVAGLARTLAEHGTLPLADVLAPAIELAEHGFPLGVPEAGRLARAAPRLAENDGARRLLLKPDGAPYDAGETLRQPELARTLRLIARHGPDVFYRGEIAERIAADMTANGGLLTRDDLAAYRAIPSIVVRGSYRGHGLVGTFLPASGMATIQILHMLQNFDRPVAASSAASSAEWAALVAQAVRIGIRDRGVELGTPEQKARTISSAEWAEQRAREIRWPRRTSDEGAAAAAAAREPVVAEEHTTHLSAADADGWYVAMTQSLGDAWGAHVVTPGLGFLYAATLGYTSVQPGTPRPRPATSQSPFMVLRDDVPVLVLGAAGGVHIISAVAQVVSRTIDERLPLADAIAAPRVHPAADTGIQLEDDRGARWPVAVWAALRDAGFAVERGTAFATVHAIAFDPTTGEFTGVADPRGAGTAAAPP
jgi:gamma-glutamyltranspeptidase / glutathione hydrolase